jgi:hypothetical protein
VTVAPYLLGDAASLAEIAGFALALLVALVGLLTWSVRRRRSHAHFSASIFSRSELLLRNDGSAIALELAISSNEIDFRSHTMRALPTEVSAGNEVLLALTPSAVAKVASLHLTWREDGDRGHRHQVAVVKRTPVTDKPEES